MIASLRGLSSAHPGLCTHQWFFWSGIFSSCVSKTNYSVYQTKRNSCKSYTGFQIVLGALVIESTGCKLAEGALREFEDALPFYEEGSASCRPSATLVCYLIINYYYLSWYMSLTDGPMSLDNVAETAETCPNCIYGVPSGYTLGIAFAW